VRRWTDLATCEIALIDPAGFTTALRRRRPGRKLFPHMGLGYVAACLERNGEQVQVLDAGVATHRELQRFLSQPAKLFGITAVSFTFREALAAARAVKQRHPSTPVIIGGPHVSIDPAGCLDDPAVDYALQGEGEDVLIDFLEVLKRSPAPSPEVLASIPGLVYRDGQRVCVQPPAPRLRALDELPYPAWHLFAMERYQQHPVLTSRGCPMDCAFCAVDAIWGRMWVHRDPAQVAAEIAWLVRTWGKKLIHINDDNLTMDPGHTEAFCDALLARRLDVDWVAQGVRADALTPALLRKMRRAGCHRVSLGIESAAPAVLEAIGKKETLEEIARAVRLCREAGILVLGMFMVGNPGDTEETVSASIRFAKESGIDLPAFYMAIPYPKTRLWEHARTQGRFLNDDYLAFTHMSVEPVFETPAFPAAARRRAYALASKFCRRQYWLYHLAFWWPGRVLRRNRFEIRQELNLYGKALAWPLRALLRRLFPPVARR
jgi:anaerobic magnesium-protoporphyrin IX monomethyl ester cyclase